MAGVRISSLAKRFGETSVIEHLDLDIADHEFMVLVGPSGCGKSTVLRMIAGLESISGGTISIGDRVVNEVEPKDRDVAMVFQSYALYPHLTIRENIEFGLKIRKLPRPEIDRLVSEAATILGIEKLLERKPRQLSGGQRQRVAVGRAIVRKPAVFLFDEPLSNLDAKLRVQMRAEIKKLQARLRTTAVYVTHDQVEAMTMGTRICVLNRGVLQQVGAPLEVYERPASAFVAQFIGTPPMNFLRGTLRDGAVAVGSLSVPLPASLRDAAGKLGGRKVIAGIRPEHVLPKGHEHRGPVLPLEVAVEIVETLGDEIVVHSRVGDDVLVYQEDAHRAPEVGARATVQVEIDRLHLFDGETELRIG
ncbi:MAG TPA: sn-glycerol-3-phosphate ABC transporter ATP-binding protein UgpC [Anaeromyxobacter sp.]|nr:sn-glycerol-3-phosphate ABC transporter ATP-binding protein UgpC [Anaeromyxobacter sp.]